MAGELDRLQGLGASQTPDKARGHMPEDVNRLSARAATPSEHEERAWLAQMQEPEGIHRHLLAYGLAGQPDIARLALAARTLAMRWPVLNSRYRFDDEGDLRRHEDGNAFDAVEILRAETQIGATRLALARQAVPFDLETDAPFRLLLILCPTETLLVLLLHRLIDESCPAESVLSGLGAAYQGLPLPRTPTPALADQTTANAIAPIGWLRRSDQGAQILSPAVSALAFPDASGAVATRHRAVAPSGLLGRDVTELTPPAVVLASLAARFAHFVALLGGHETINLAVPRLPGSALGEPGYAYAASDRASLTVAVECPVTETTAAILAQIATGEAASKSGLPQVTVTWLADPNDFFDAGGLRLERLPLPTLEPQADLDLGVGRTADGHLLLELTTGQAVSAHAGALLIDRFIAFLDDPTILESLPACGTAPLRSIAAPPVEQNNPPEETNGIEALILAAFREALGSPEMGPQDDFFDHGGHSLIATRIIGRLLGNHGIEVHFNDLFSYPTAATLARHARRSEAQAIGLPDVAGASGSLSAPLSLAQMSLWKAYAAFGFNEIFNIPFALDFLDPVDERVFECAFLDIVERHPGLRTLFCADGEEVLQQVVPMYDLPGYKWFWTSDESANVGRNSEAGHRFDLARELPIRLRFLKEPASGRQTLSFLFHHIVLDEWSVNLMMDELAEAYRARAAGKAPHWTTEPAPFHEFARKQAAAGVNADHLAYWTNMLHDAPKGLPMLGAAQERPAPDKESQSSAAGGWVEFKLDHAVTEGLYATAKESSASLFNVAYAAIAASLNRLGGVCDLVVGTSASGRIDPAYFDTVGYFTTVVAHRLRFSPATTLGELIATVKNTVNESLPHSEIPIDLIEEALGMTPGRDHLFEVFIQIHAKNKLNGTLQTADGRAIEFRQVDPERHESLLGLHFEVMEEMIAGERSIRVLMSYRTEHYSPEQVEAIRTTTRDVFARFARSGAMYEPVSSLPAIG